METLTYASTLDCFWHGMFAGWGMGFVSYIVVQGYSFAWRIFER